MTNEQKLQALIETAVKNGWEDDEHFSVDLNEIRFNSPNIHLLMKLKDSVQGFARSYFNQNVLRVINISEVFFSHSFAKAVFPKSIEIMPGLHDDGWQYHLQQLAITPENERIDYCYKNMSHTTKGEG